MAHRRKVAHVVKDGTALGPSSGPAGGGDSSATSTPGGGSSGGTGATPDTPAADDTKTDVKMETRGPEWLQQQQQSSLIKPEINTNARTSPCPSPSLSDPPASIADDSSTGGGRDLDDDEEDDADDEKADAHHDPERLKAFNMFVRLFVDENLDRMVPISKQPKEKIQAIIDACGRQFPEFSERTRKRIRTYLKSCRRNKRTRDSNGWEGGRPTPPHLTSLQAEQLLATACENEAQNAKRMRLGLEPVAQPHPYQQQQPTIAVVGTDKGVSYMEVTSVVAKSEPVTKVTNVLEGKLVNGTAGGMVAGGGLVAGGGIVSGATGGLVSVAGGAVTVFQPVVTSLASTTSSGAFQQTFQHATYQKITTAPVSSAVNGPTDLSMRGGAVPHHPAPSSAGLLHQSPASSGAPVYTNPCVTSIGGNLSGGLGVMPNNTINIGSGGNIVIAATGTNNGLNHCGGNTINTSTIGLVANSNCNTITNNNISDVSATANMTTIGVSPNNTVVNNSGGIAMVANPSIGTAPMTQGTMAPAMVNNASGGVAIVGGGVSGGNPGGAINMTNSSMAAATAVKARPTLSPVEVAAVRQLITGYRESAAFLLRSAEELQNLIHQQGS